MILLFNHTLTNEQLEAAKNQLGESEITELPTDLKKIWSAVDPEAESLQSILNPMLEWLQTQPLTQRHVLVQGDFGAVFYMVSWLMHHGAVPVYSTTKRQAVERKDAQNNIVVERTIKHVRYRKYQYGFIK